jgi:hypothetical protein
MMSFPEHPIAGINSNFILNKNVGEANTPIKLRVTNKSD